MIIRGRVEGKIYVVSFTIYRTWAFLIQDSKLFVDKLGRKIAHISMSI